MLFLTSCLVLSCSKNNTNPLWAENPCGADTYYSLNLLTPPPSSTGVGNINDDLISVYPNPSNNEWHISFTHFNNMDAYAVTLYNISGTVGMGLRHL